MSERAVPALDGSPLAAAVIGVADLSRSMAFYRDLIGMDVVHAGRWQGRAFERHWGLPSGSAASSALLAASDAPVGRVLLLEFTASARQRVRQPGLARAYGLANLNFYTADIHRDAERLRGAGYRFWSAPVHYDLGPEVGTPIEVVFEGPDDVPVNLVELASTDPATRIGQMRAYVEQHGRTRTGFTPVVTSAQVVRDLERARAFCEQVLGMRLLIDEVLDSPDTNRLLGLPAGSRSRVQFMQGGHPFGKLALTQPLNYACEDLVPRAVPPNIGYVAQQFLVADLQQAAAVARALAAPVYTPAVELDLPGLGRCAAMLLRNPGSGALQELVQAL
ncbi:MAG: VOC family protein [Gammaproteobacteria bacterium]|nr:MAG: VOC family protein [Gammaproteobacteria bacterium]